MLVETQSSLYKILAETLNLTTSTQKGYMDACNIPLTLAELSKEEAHTGPRHSRRMKFIQPEWK